MWFIKSNTAGVGGNILREKQNHLEGETDLYTKGEADLYTKQERESQCVPYRVIIEYSVSMIM